MLLHIRRPFAASLWLVLFTCAALSAGCSQVSPVSPSAPSASSPLTNGAVDTALTAADTTSRSLAVVTGSNRIEGTVTFSANGKWGRAANARIEVIVNGTNTVVHRGSADTSGEYVGFAGEGQFRVKATFVYQGRTLRGLSNIVWFRGNGGRRAQGVNILVS